MLIIKYIQELKAICAVRYNDRKSIKSDGIKGPAPLLIHLQLDALARPQRKIGRDKSRGSRDWCGSKYSFGGT